MGGLVKRGPGRGALLRGGSLVKRGPRWGALLKGGSLVKKGSGWGASLRGGQQPSVLGVGRFWLGLKPNSN